MIVLGSFGGHTWRPKKATTNSATSSGFYWGGPSAEIPTEWCGNITSRLFCTGNTGIAGKITSFHDSGWYRKRHFCRDDARCISPSRQFERAQVTGNIYVSSAGSVRCFFQFQKWLLRKKENMLHTYLCYSWWNMNSDCSKASDTVLSHTSSTSPRATSNNSTRTYLGL